MSPGVDDSEASVEHLTNPARPPKTLIYNRRYSQLDKTRLTPISASEQFHEGAGRYIRPLAIHRREQPARICWVSEHSGDLRAFPGPADSEFRFCAWGIG